MALIILGHRKPSCNVHSPPLQRIFGSSRKNDQSTRCSHRLLSLLEPQISQTLLRQVLNCHRNPLNVPEWLRIKQILLLVLLRTHCGDQRSTPHTLRWLQRKKILLCKQPILLHIHYNPPYNSHRVPKRLQISQNLLCRMSLLLQLLSSRGDHRALHI